MNAKELLKYYFGHDDFRPHQLEIINDAIGGKDTLVLMPTGGGKSLCYQIPALSLPGTAIVVSPLISLMNDQVQALKSNGIPAETLNSGTPSDLQALIRRKCQLGDIKLLYISPERMMAELEHLLVGMHPSLFAIDEAHCISQWGHDFRPEYAQLGIIHQQFPHVPIMALTATADKLTRHDIIRQLKLNVSEKRGIYISSFDRPNLNLKVMHGYSQGNKDAFVINFIRHHRLEPGIIYCLSRKNAESLFIKLNRHGISAACYHAGMPPSSREAVQATFRNDHIQVVCATIAFGMGIDKSNIRWIIHYNMPKSIEGFYQEIGRAGRDGLPAETIMFHSLQDVVQLSKFIDDIEDENLRKKQLEKLRLMRQYAEASICRRRILLNYFNEPFDHNCGNCDVCSHPPKSFDGTIVIQKALSAAARTLESRSSGVLIDILMGKATDTIRRNGYDHLPTFGKGRDCNERQWRDYFLQMQQMGYIEIDYEHYNAVKITPMGWEVVRGKQKACLINNTVDDSPTRIAPKRLKLKLPHLRMEEDIDNELFEQLRQLRMQLAKAAHVPPFVIMNDKVLSTVATAKPKSVEEFGALPGIGEYKKQHLAEPFIKIIAAYLAKGKE